jgi:hypothetical protein
MIVLPNIDNIFDDQKHVEETEYPLCAQHPHNPVAKFRKAITCQTIKTPRMKWVYANFIFTKKHDWFFHRVLGIMEKFAPLGRITGGTAGDEAAVNAVLVDAEADTNMGYNYFPNGLQTMIDYYFDNNDEAGTKELNDTYLLHPANGCDKVVFYAFHAHLIKDASYTASLLERIKLENDV